MIMKLFSISLKNQIRNIFLKTTFLLLFQIFFLYGQQTDAPSPPDGYWNTTFLKMAYFIGTLELIEKKPAIPPQIQEYKDVVYKQTTERDLMLDIYHLKNLPEQKPALVFIHGGAWKKGDKSDYRRYLVDFALRGYVTVTLAYRFSQEALFPAAVNDVKCAIRWIKKNAKKYNIDPNNIAVIGGSAGGHLAMMIAYSSDKPEFDENCDLDSINSNIQAVVNLYGPSDLTTDFAMEQPPVHKFIGELYKDAKEKYRQASPINYITPDDPPTLIFQGTLDEIVPVLQSDLLNDKLIDEEVQVEYHRLEGWPHTMDLGLEVNKYCQYYMNAFFEKHLK